MRGLLVDVNVLLALLHEDHMHSTSARTWLAGIDEPSSLIICRTVQLGALRLLTRTAVMGSAVLTAADALEAITRVTQDERFEFMEEPPGFDRAWFRVCASIPKGSVAETDAYLAAFAVSAELGIATFDRGMTRFASVRVIDPGLS